MIHSGVGCPRRCRASALPGVRRGFLVLDMLAGSALAAIALGMAVVLVHSDVKVRRTQELRHRILVRAENALARIETLDPAVISKETVEKVLADLEKVDDPGSTEFEIDVTSLDDEPRGKRVVLRGRESSDRPPAVFLVRDYRFENGGR